MQTELESEKGRLLAQLKNAISLSDDTGNNLSITVIRDEEDPRKRSAWARIGNIEVWHFKECDDVRWDYEPLENKSISDVDPSTIKNFMDPPEKSSAATRLTLTESEQEESPATDQSTQG